MRVREGGKGESEVECFINALLHVPKCATMRLNFQHTPLYITMDFNNFNMECTVLTGKQPVNKQKHERYVNTSHCSRELR